MSVNKSGLVDSLCIILGGGLSTTFPMTDCIGLCPY